MNFDAYRRAAQRRLPRGIFEYVDRGAEDETGLAHNRAVLDECRFQPRVLNESGVRDQTLTLFDQPLAAPLIVAPTAFAGLLRHRGEIAAARAARQLGIPYCAATESITAVEDIVGTAGGNIWFQLYLWDDFEASKRLCDRAWQHGIRTLVVTVDTPVSPKREYNIRNGFGLPLRMRPRNVADVLAHPSWMADVLMRSLFSGPPIHFANYPAERRPGLIGQARTTPMAHTPSLGWAQIRLLRQSWRGTLVVKGILHEADARICVENGVDGIVVSNHGARNLDHAVSPLDVLPRIVDAVGTDIVVLADSGIRRGSDVLKMLASGARAVLVGRAFLYGIAAAGERGATEVGQMLMRELDAVIAMTGCKDVRAVPRALLWSRSSLPTHTEGQPRERV